MICIRIALKKIKKIGRFSSAHVAFNGNDSASLYPNYPFSVKVFGLHAT